MNRTHFYTYLLSQTKYFSRNDMTNNKHNLETSMSSHFSISKGTICQDTAQIAEIMFEFPVQSQIEKSCLRTIHRLL